MPFWKNELRCENGCENGSINEWVDITSMKRSRISRLFRQSQAKFWWKLMIEKSLFPWRKDHFSTEETRLIQPNFWAFSGCPLSRTSRWRVHGPGITTTMYTTRTRWLGTIPNTRTCGSPRDAVGTVSFENLTFFQKNHLSVLRVAETSKYCSLTHDTFVKKWNELVWSYAWVLWAQTLRIIPTILVHFCGVIQDWEFVMEMRVINLPHPPSWKEGSKIFILISIKRSQFHRALQHQTDHNFQKT